MKKTIGSSIRLARRDRQISLQRLAKDVGTSAATLSRIENGHQDVTASVLLRLLDVLGVAPAAFFAGLSGALRAPAAESENASAPLTRQMNEAFFVSRLRIMGGADDLEVTFDLLLQEIDGLSAQLRALQLTQPSVHEVGESSADVRRAASRSESAAILRDAHPASRRGALIIGDGEEIDRVVRALGPGGMSLVELATTAGEASERLRSHDYALVVVDLKEGRPSLMTEITASTSRMATKPIVILSAAADDAQPLDSDLVSLVIRRPLDESMLAGIIRTCLSLAETSQQAGRESRTGAVQ